MTKELESDMPKYVQTSLEVEYPKKDNSTENTQTKNNKSKKTITAKK